MSGNLIEASLAELLEDGELWGANGLMPVRLEMGEPGSRVVLATGPNACGKSFACRYLGSGLAELRKEREGIKEGEFFHIGMRMRTSGAGFISAKSFVYGNEGDASTGATSLRAVNGALQTSRGRERRHLIALDEPEVGLSDEYAIALAEKIRAFASDLPPPCDGLVIVTHSRAFVGHMMALKPHCLRFGPLSTKEWLSRPPVPATVEDLDSLSDRNLQTYRAILKILEKRNRKRARA